MPSRAEVRGGMEAVSRVASIAILSWMLWLSFDRARPESAAAVRFSGLSSSLRSLSSSGMAPDDIAVQLDSTPAPVDRDWLGALRGAGSRVSWTGDLPVTAIGVQPVVSPRNGFTVLVAAPSGTSVRLSDGVGIVDTAVATSGGARFSIRAATGEISAVTGRATASAALPPGVQVRRILVLGSAGWESKFVVAALEEEGWKVDSEMRIARGVSVTQGSSSPLDTSRYSAVIGLDVSAASRASEIVKFVTSGGGVILAGTAAASDAFSGIRPGAPGRTEPAPVVFVDSGSMTLASLSVSPTTSLRNDAVPLEKRGASLTIAARRHGSGKVLQHGYIDTWRWRLRGGDAAPREHRAWWTRVVSSVAYVPADILTNPAEADDAPVARLLATLGPSAAAPSSSLAGKAGSIPVWILFAILVMALLGEWASRRLRGAR